MTPQSPPGSTPPALPATRTQPQRSVPLYAAFALLIVGGLVLLNRADQQTRDTVRKHHLEDIEQALYVTRNQHGTYPPYAAPTWCGRLDAPTSADVRAQIETALRAQNEKYANPAKPFPSDPLAGENQFHYFYWKHSPASFELYAALEAAPTGERSTHDCPSESTVYDYGIASVWREDT